MNFILYLCFQIALTQENYKNHHETEVQRTIEKKQAIELSNKSATEINRILHNFR